MRATPCTRLDVQTLRSNTRYSTTVIYAFMLSIYRAAVQYAILGCGLSVIYLGM